MIVPEGVKVYGPGKQVFKAGQEIPHHLKKVKGVEEAVQKAGDKYAGKKQIKKDDPIGSEKPKENLFDKKGEK